MALRVTRLLVPTGAAALNALNVARKVRFVVVVQAGVHTSPVRSLRYGWLSYVLGERTTPRLNQNSRIITLDGNLSSGKGAMAQQLADKLGMLYMPEADTFYMDKMTGEKEPLPVDFNGMCSLEKFYTEPRAADGNSYRLQLWMYTMRLLQYADAIEHLLTTGQGVVLERSPFSDFVFLDAMFNEGYIRPECVQHYNEIKGISLCEFLPPHIVIYMDLPAEEVQKKLQQSGKSHLQNVPLSYLKGIEDSYKNSFLPQISEKTDVFSYDMTKALNVKMLVDDIKYSKFEGGPWLEQDDISYHQMRMLVEDKQRVATLTHIPKFLPEITIGAHDYDEKYYAFRSLPGKKYASGYNADVGDKFIWLK
ncbi:NADH dehydrogenase [ubiquinone] 1 alpha subcomplex subunit 10, mitochondrial isoform X1 [Cyclopterus lumpus]|uniref:NADH dehydrogenase [ubiquinone] 1 alpha subcomplex subunit 10, mitochondrial isoform X1 n=1 Tax=Cyclopterus lumpus TaxID=8103 RepID=UPI001485F1E6|nr:NADH dehydrogenase [ubiquinone] 1 alpha subcomplex subunit 10, mitochondrial isoform X1 [Cyclopterus lumpus]